MTLRVVLVGLPGVGKTSVGLALAARLDVGFIDLDDVVASRCGAPVAPLLREHGEAAFRRFEAEALAAVLAEDGAAVVATGGGTVESEDVRRRLATTPLVVQLVAPPSVLLGRLGGTDRPLLEAPTEAMLAALEVRRGAWYDEVAGARVDASGSIDEVVDAIAQLVVRT